MTEQNETQVTATADPTPPEVKNFRVSEAELLTDDEPNKQEFVGERSDAQTQALLAIVKRMEQLGEREAAIRQIPYNEMLPHTPWNPEGKRTRKEFSRPTFLQGIACIPLTHTEAEMALFNKLKPGRYLNRRLEVQKSSDGAINVSWPGKFHDARMQFYAEYPSITLLLTAAIAEREAKEAKRRNGIWDDDDEA